MLFVHVLVAHVENRSDWVTIDRMVYLDITIYFTNINCTTHTQTHTHGINKDLFSFVFSASRGKW